MEKFKKNSTGEELRVKSLSKKPDAEITEFFDDWTTNRTAEPQINGRST